MTRALIVHRGGPHLTVQDLGRPGHLAQGLSRGGAADRLALAEGAALLGQPPELAALEMAGAGGEVEATEDLRIALTGAPMRAEWDGGGGPLAWNASHALPKGARLRIGGALAGSYGYLHVGGGIATAPVLGARAAHVPAGLGRAPAPGDRLPVGPDPRPREVGQGLDPPPRLAGGTVRIVPGLHADWFPPETLARFEATSFRRDARGNRMGVRLLPGGPGFHSAAGLSVLSEVIVPGDIQITGDGVPTVLLADCQTTGGYPRIATVIPADLPLVAQAGPGAEIRLRPIPLADALAIERAEHARIAGLRATLRPLVRRPEDIGDLLAYQLIGGVTAGDEMEGSAQ